MTSLTTMPQWSAEERREWIEHFEKSGAPASFVDEIYGMPNAAEDLKVRPLGFVGNGEFELKVEKVKVEKADD